MKISHIILGLLIIFSACKSYKPAEKTNISIAYNPDQNKLHPDITFYHESRDSTVIYLRQNRREMGRNKDKAAKLKLEYQILKNYSSDEVIDSTSIFIKDTLQKEQGLYMKYSTKIELPVGESYVIKTKLYDLIRDDYVLDYHPVSKESIYDKYFFKILDDKNKLQYNPLLKKNNKFRLQYGHASKLYVRYFSEELKIPPPPYMNSRNTDLKFKTDSIFTITLENGKSPVQEFKKKGIYHIQADSTLSKGLTMFYFLDYYPQIQTHKQMIPVTKYIATESEYKDLLEAEDAGQAIDNFWLSLTDNKERAKILIRNYYTRVRQANKMFYSHKPGWKTDRGMFYIVMGPPQVVYRSNKLETWIYGESSKYNALEVNFKKVNNPFSENDFSLNRTPTLKDDWYFAIDVWRR